jgi:predicted nucleic acid-binding protein
LVISYLDTSAAMKLLVDEAESAALAAYLQTAADRVAASWLLHTELHRAAARHPDTVDHSSVTIVLDAVSLVDVTRGDLLTAAALPGRLRSNDAIHLAVALRLGVDEVVTYDAELVDAATVAGLAVRQPG